jgi:hypothetical protein
MIFQYYATTYTELRASNYVGDIFLDNLPVLNLNFIIVEGALIVFLLTFVLVFAKPKYILFSIKAFALFVALRSLFIAVTHVGFYPDQINPGNGFFDHIYIYLNMQTGYFFSAHTGLPFLMALVFWRDRIWRNLFLVISFVFGFAVLLSHVHYSIDVFAAPFMAYAIFKGSQYLFSEDYRIINPSHVSRGHCML